MATIATLEIAPMHERERWLLTVTVEDEIDPRMPSNGFDLGTEQIDLGTFYNKFIRPGRGIANVVTRAGSPSARAKLNYLLSAIERDQHVAERTSRSRQPVNTSAGHVARKGFELDSENNPRTRHNGLLQAP